MNTNSRSISMCNFPEDLIESEIFPFLTSKDLFYSVRGVSTSWYDMMKDEWSRKIKDEMIDQVKSLDFIYEKEILTKTYEFKSKFLLNYKGLLTSYISNANVLWISKSLIPFITTEPQVKTLLQLIFTFCEMPLVLDKLNSGEFESLESTLESIASFTLFRARMMEILNIETTQKDEDTINMFKSNFQTLNKEYLENLSEHAKLLYSFFQGMVEFYSLKIEILNLKQKINYLIMKFVAPLFKM